MIMKKRITLLFCLFILCCFAIYSKINDNYTIPIEYQRFYVSSNYKDENAYIAHGGGINEYNGTNSLQSVQNSIKNGFKFIEIDMLETSDGYIVGSHDWKKLKKLTNYPKINDRPLSLKEVNNLKINGKFDVITGADIKNIMEQNQDLILVTDKIKNYDLLLKEIPYPERMIVEVFSAQDYFRALKTGIKYPAYCIWNIEKYKEARKFQFPIVTMDAKKFFQTEETIQMVQQLHNSKVTILLFYTSFPQRDKPEWVKQYLGKTVSKIYTDTWSPHNLPHSVPTMSKE